MVLDILSRGRDRLSSSQRTNSRTSSRDGDRQRNNNNNTNPASKNTRSSSSSSSALRRSNAILADLNADGNLDVSVRMSRARHASASPKRRQRLRRRSTSSSSSSSSSTESSPAAPPPPPSSASAASPSSLSLAAASASLQAHIGELSSDTKRRLRKKKEKRSLIAARNSDPAPPASSQPQSMLTTNKTKFSSSGIRRDLLWFRRSASSTRGGDDHEDAVDKEKGEMSERHRPLLPITKPKRSRSLSIDQTPRRAGSSSRKDDELAYSSLERELSSLRLFNNDHEEDVLAANNDDHGHICRSRSDGGAATNNNNAKAAPYQEAEEPPPRRSNSNWEERQERQRRHHDRRLERQRSVSRLREQAARRSRHNDRTMEEKSAARRMSSPDGRGSRYEPRRLSRSHRSGDNRSRYDNDNDGSMRSRTSRRELLNSSSLREEPSRTSHRGEPSRSRREEPRLNKDNDLSSRSQHRNNMNDQSSRTRSRRRDVLNSSWQSSHSRGEEEDKEEESHRRMSQSCQDVMSTTRSRRSSLSSRKELRRSSTSTMQQQRSSTRRSMQATCSLPTPRVTYDEKFDDDGAVIKQGYPKVGWDNIDEDQSFHRRESLSRSPETSRRLNQSYQDMHSSRHEESPLYSKRRSLDEDDNLPKWKPRSCRSRSSGRGSMQSSSLPTPRVSDYGDNEEYDADRGTSSLPTPGVTEYDAGRSSSYKKIALEKELESPPSVALDDGTKEVEQSFATLARRRSITSSRSSRLSLASLPLYDHAQRQSRVANHDDEPSSIDSASAPTSSRRARAGSQDGKESSSVAHSTNKKSFSRLRSLSLELRSSSSGRRARSTSLTRDNIEHVNDITGADSSGLNKRGDQFSSSPELCSSYSAYDTLMDETLAKSIDCITKARQLRRTNSTNTNNTSASCILARRNRRASSVEPSSRFSSIRRSLGEDSLLSAFKSITFSPSICASADSTVSTSGTREQHRAGMVDDALRVARASVPASQRRWLSPSPQQQKQPSDAARQLLQLSLELNNGDGGRRKDNPSPDNRNRSEREGRLAQERDRSPSIVDKMFSFYDELKMKKDTSRDAVKDNPKSKAPQDMHSTSKDQDLTESCIRENVVIKADESCSFYGLEGISNQDSRENIHMELDETVPSLQPVDEIELKLNEYSHSQRSRPHQAMPIPPPPARRKLPDKLLVPSLPTNDQNSIDGDMNPEAETAAVVESGHNQYHEDTTTVSSRSQHQMLLRLAPPPPPPPPSWAVPKIFEGNHISEMDKEAIDEKILERNVVIFVPNNVSSQAKTVSHAQEGRAAVVVPEAIEFTVADSGQDQQKQEEENELSSSLKEPMWMSDHISMNGGEAETIMSAYKPPPSRGDKHVSTVKAQGQMIRPPPPPPRLPSFPPPAHPSPGANLKGTRGGGDNYNDSASEACTKPTASDLLRLHPPPPPCRPPSRQNTSNIAGSESVIATRTKSSALDLLSLPPPPPPPYPSGRNRSDESSTTGKTSFKTDTISEVEGNTSLPAQTIDNTDTAIVKKPPKRNSSRRRRKKSSTPSGSMSVVSRGTATTYSLSSVSNYSGLNSGVSKRSRSRSKRRSADGTSIHQEKKS